MSYTKGLMFAALLVFIAGTVNASDTLKQFDGIKGRAYHADFYTENSCDSCHDSKQPLNFPADDACLECHDQEDLIQATSRPEDEKWQNPHNNIHYGKDVPCMECHGEHQSGNVLCLDCHSFSYENFKK